MCRGHSSVPAAHYGATVLVQTAGAPGRTEAVTTGGGGERLFHEQRRREAARGELPSHPAREGHVTKTTEIAHSTEKPKKEGNNPAILGEKGMLEVTENKR